MKNWEMLEADQNLILTKHFTRGRSGAKIDKIVIHHNAGNLSVEGCYNVWQTRQASAHYQVETSGKIGQLVWDTDTAWHAGDWNANITSIGIEHADESSSPWKISEACLDNGAHLVAALCKFYKLGRPEWLKNVFPHSHFCATGCPASLQAEQKDAYMKRAGEWYDRMTGNATPQTPATRAVSVQLYQPNNTDAQVFKPTWEKAGYAYIVNKASGLALDVKDGDFKDGQPVRVHTLNKTGAQRFKLKEENTITYNPTSVKPFYIVPADAPELCVAAMGTEARSGVRIQKQQGKTTQLWQILDQLNGEWKIVNVSSGLALDVVNGGKR